MSTNTISSTPKLKRTLSSYINGLNNSLNDMALNLKDSLALECEQIHANHPMFLGLGIMIEADYNEDTDEHGRPYINSILAKTDPSILEDSWADKMPVDQEINASNFYKFVPIHEMYKQCILDEDLMDALINLKNSIDSNRLIASIIVDHFGANRLLFAYDVTSKNFYWHEL